MLVLIRACPTVHARIAHERARTGRCRESRSATGTAEDATHVHAHALTPLARVKRARPPTIDGHTHAQRRAKLALPHLSPETELLAVLARYGT
eukprot:6647199-Prymnesium_polylepis.1